MPKSRTELLRQPTRSLLCSKSSTPGFLLCNLIISELSLPLCRRAILIVLTASYQRVHQFQDPPPDCHNGDSPTSGRINTLEHVLKWIPQRRTNGGPGSLDHRSADCWVTAFHDVPATTDVAGRVDPWNESSVVTYLRGRLETPAVTDVSQERHRCYRTNTGYGHQQRCLFTPINRRLPNQPIELGNSLLNFRKDHDKVPGKFGIYSEERLHCGTSTLIPGKIFFGNGRLPGRHKSEWSRLISRVRSFFRKI